MFPTVHQKDSDSTLERRCLPFVPGQGKRRAVQDDCLQRQPYRNGNNADYPARVRAHKAAPYAAEHKRRGGGNLLFNSDEPYVHAGRAAPHRNEDCADWRKGFSSEKRKSLHIKNKLSLT